MWKCTVIVSGIISCSTFCATSTSCHHWKVYWTFVRTLCVRCKIIHFCLHFVTERCDVHKHVFTFEIKYVCILWSLHIQWQELLIFIYIHCVAMSDVMIVNYELEWSKRAAVYSILVYKEMLSRTATLDVWPPW